VTKIDLFPDGSWIDSGRESSSIYEAPIKWPNGKSCTRTGITDLRRNWKVPGFNFIKSGIRGIPATNPWEAKQA